MAAFCRLAEVVIRALSCLVIFIAMKLFEELGKRMERLSAISVKRNVNADFLSIRLEKWLGHYDLVCQLVDHINFCFGSISLIFMISEPFLMSHILTPSILAHHIIRHFIPVLACYAVNKQVRIMRVSGYCISLLNR